MAAGEFMNKSRFNMWRAVVAMIHADNVVQPHEIHFIAEQTKNLDLSEEQRGIVNDDMQTPQDINSFFHGMTNPKDKEDFFHFARALSWSDGVFSVNEKDLLENLRNLHMAAEDISIMEEAAKSFQGFYIDGGHKRQATDSNIVSLIGKLVGKKAA